MIRIEAEKLYNEGWAVHWIKPKSKAPVKSGWSSPTRDTWEELIESYQPGYGLGVRLGAASFVGGGYLANIDVDVKSDDKKHLKEVLAFIDEKFPGVRQNALRVKTGYGFRFFVKTKIPIQSSKLTQSPDLVTVFMPSAPQSKQQLQAVASGLLTAERLEAGYRVRPAWEIEFMSAGKQVLLPPTVHPDTGLLYAWAGGPEIPLIDDKSFTAARETKAKDKIKRFKPTGVVLEWFDLDEDIMAMVRDGRDVVDRSSALMTCVNHMLKKEMCDDDILTVLTDPENFMFEVAYERRGEDRSSQADWLREYTLRKAKETLGARGRVEVIDVVGETVTPPPGGNTGELGLDDIAEEMHWTAKIKRNRQGVPRISLENVLLILRNSTSEPAIKQDLLSHLEIYGTDCPWFNGTNGKYMTDRDLLHIREFIGNTYGFEPGSTLIDDSAKIIGEENAFHPIREEILGLPLWDGIPRLNTWLRSYFNSHMDEEYLAQVFRKWMVAAVTRVFKPGTKFDCMPILQGRQGIGKSTFAVILFGQKYFCDWMPPLSDKDAAYQLQGLWCAEFGELAVLKKTEIETVKSFISRTEDKYRAAFERKRTIAPRQVVFLGTTNADKFLIDEENRRFWPVEVGQLNFEQLKKDRDQLLAEAYAIHLADNEKLDLEGDAIGYLIEIQKDKKIITNAHITEEILHEWIRKEFKKPIEERFHLNKFEVKDLFELSTDLPFDKTNRNDFTYKSINQALRLLGQTHKDLLVRKFKSGTRYWSIFEKGKELAE